MELLTLCATALTVAAGIQQGFDVAAVLAVTTAAFIMVAAFLHARQRLGIVNAMTVMLATWLVGFWVKRLLPWAPDSTAGQEVVERSLVVAAVFGVAFTAGYILPFVVGRAPLGTAAARAREGPSRPALLVLPLVVVCLALTALRLYLGLQFSVGVPGVRPQPIPLGGALFAVSAYAPLAIIASLAAVRRKAATITVPFLALAYGLAGATLGWRSSIFLAIIAGVLGYNLAGPRLAGRRRLAFPVKFALIATLAVPSGYVFMRAAQARSSALTGASPLQRLADRLGGANYLEPVVAAVQLFGTDLSRLSPVSSQRFTLTSVYGLPAEAVTGFAPTGAGFLFAAGGFYIVAVGAAILGSLAALADLAPAAWRTGPVVALALFPTGVHLALLNFLLEGTPAAALLVLTGFAVGLAICSLARSSKFGDQA